MLKNDGEKLWILNSDKWWKSNWLSSCYLSDNNFLQSSPKYFWLLRKVPHKPGHLGSPASAVQGCCLGIERVSIMLLSSSASRRPLSTAECYLQGESPKFQPSRGQWVLGFLQRWMDKAGLLPGISHASRDRLWGPLPLGQLLPAPPGLVGEGTTWFSPTLDPSNRA